MCYGCAGRVGLEGREHEAAGVRGAPWRRGGRWPLAARAQQPALPVVGFLYSLGRNDRGNLLDAFRRGLNEAGYAEGRNVAIEYRCADNQIDRLPALAADLVSRNVAVIVATGGGYSTLAAKAATTTIPIVFVTAATRCNWASSPASTSRVATPPGVSWFGSQLAGKGLGLLNELVPKAALVAFWQTRASGSSAHVERREKAARALGQQLLVLNAGTPSEIDAAFATLRQWRADALLLGGDPFFSSRRQQDCSADSAGRHPGHVRQP